MTLPNVRPLSVVKVGGSLLDLPDLFPRLQDWLANRRFAPVVVMGGGPGVEEIRRQHAAGEITAGIAHWRSIAVMSANARAASQQLPGSRLVQTFDQVATIVDKAPLKDANRPVVILDPATELQADGGRSLPVGWEVTSDSIAAWLAAELRAAEFYLLKSVGDNDPVDLADALEQGWVDEHFPMVAEPIYRARRPIRLVNFRSQPVMQAELQPLE